MRQLVGALVKLVIGEPFQALAMAATTVATIAAATAAIPLRYFSFPQSAVYYSKTG